MNASKLLFSDDDPFRVVSVDNCDDELRIYVKSTSPWAVCPNCCIQSRKIHSYYSRKVSDLPVFSKKSLIFLQARKFYCHHEECPLKVFTERFDNHFKPYMRKTLRLESRLRQLGLLCGGKTAERICKITSISSSDTTILRLIKKEVFIPLEGASAVGVDDWAFKKRKSYGSILVNLHTGKVIDLLPDREEVTLSDWLKKRPEIEVMSRDRFSNYQKAMTIGAPQAIQVTDRWHLLKNLSEAVQKVLIKYYNKTNIKLTEETQNEDNKTSCVQDISFDEKSSSKTDQDGVRLQRFKELKALQGKGYSIRAMSRHLNMSRQTIKKYLDMETLPRKSYGSNNAIERFFPYIKTRMEKEPTIFLTTLWEELKSKGYKGGYSTLSEALRYYDIRVGKKTGLTKKLPTRAGASFKPSTAAIGS